MYQVTTLIHGYDIPPTSVFCPTQTFMHGSMYHTSQAMNNAFRIRTLDMNLYFHC